MTTRAAGLLAVGLATVRPAFAAVIDVPSAVPTIREAVEIAGPGDVIRVAPGDYTEHVRIEGERTGLTIESADPGRPFTLHGTPNASIDGVRVDKVDGVTLRNFRIVGAYNGVRLNRVAHAVLSGLHVEDAALGIRVSHGRDNAILGCTVIATRVEQGIRVDGSPGVVLADNVTEDTDEQGIRVIDSAGALVVRNVVRNARGNDGIAVSKSPGARVTDCSAIGSYHDGFRVARSQDLVFARNVAQANLSVGIRIERCWPFLSIDDVLAAGNVAAGNGQRQILVIPGGRCTADGCMTTTTATPSTLPPTSTTQPATTSTIGATTSTTSTLTTPTTLPAGSSRFRLYVRIVRTGGETNVDVPKRSSDAPLAVGVADPSAFAPGDRVTAEKVDADTAARLSAAARAYVAAHPADYPGFAGSLALRWAQRVP
jgi:hypothetical protein